MLEFKTSYRYAKSLLDLSAKDNLLNTIYKDVILVNTICRNNKDLVLILKSPLIYSDKKLRILKKIFYDKINNLTFSFLDLINKKGRLPLLLDITEVFILEYKKVNLIKDVKITTAISLSDELRDKFRKIIKTAISCKKVNLIEDIDKSLIGGYVLSVDDKKLDESIKNKLSLLKLNFLNSGIK